MTRSASSDETSSPAHLAAAAVLASTLALAGASGYRVFRLDCGQA